ncbi:MAG TPA: S4 domain-containing protein [Acidimicrobiales bacterium]|nr:S4 domain-containing protein [Acidimicrobiales bacterium]
MAGELLSTRVDRWLWAVRIYPSRSAATGACRGGHVKVNRMPAKPATAVRVGDTVTAYAGGRMRVLEVTRVIERRVGAALAAECLADRTPPTAREDARPALARPASSGRPTKRDRRRLDRFRRS